MAPFPPALRAAVGRGEATVPPPPRHGARAGAIRLCRPMVPSWGDGHLFRPAGRQQAVFDGRLHPSRGGSGGGELQGANPRPANRSTGATVACSRGVATRPSEVDPGELSVQFPGSPSPLPYRVIALDGRAADGYRLALVYTCTEEPRFRHTLFVLNWTPHLRYGREELAYWAVWLRRRGIRFAPDNQLVATPQGGGCPYRGDKGATVVFAYWRGGWVPWEEGAGTPACPRRRGGSGCRPRARMCIRRWPVLIEILIYDVGSLTAFKNAFSFFQECDRGGGGRVCPLPHRCARRRLESHTPRGRRQDTNQGSVWCHFYVSGGGPGPPSPLGVRHCHPGNSAAARVVGPAPPPPRTRRHP